MNTHTNAVRFGRSPPADLERRLALLAELHILDTPSEPDFDAVTVLVSKALGAPIALISLLDAKRQWFKARVGIEVPETALAESLCLHTCAEGDMLVIEDAREHPGFADHPATLGELAVRFYAGVPLMLEGVPVGALCAVDRRPRVLQGADREVLQAAATVVCELLTRRLQHQRAQAAERAAVELAVASCDWTWNSDAQGRLMAIEGGFEACTGRPSSAMLGLRLREAAGDAQGRHEASWRSISEAQANGQPFRQLPVLWDTTHGSVRTHLTGMPILSADGALSGYRGAAVATARSQGAPAPAEAEAEQPTLAGDGDGLAQRPCADELLTIDHAFNALPAHITVIDGQGRIVCVNAPAADMHGHLGLRGAGAWIGRHFADYCDAALGVAAEDILRAKDCIAAVLSRQSAKRQLDYACQTTNPAQWLRLIVTPILDRGTSGAVMMQVDISEGRRAELALQRSEALLDMAGRAARVGAWSYDVGTGMLAWSGQTAALHDEPAGYSPSLQRAIEYYDGGDRAVVEQAFERCLHSGEPFDVELRSVSARGVRRWLRAIGSAERGPRGEVVRVQGAVQDVSPRREAEHQRRELTRRLQSTLDSITDGFVTLDRQWRATHINDRAQDLLGVPRQRWQGRDARQALPALARSAIGRQLLRAMRQQRAACFEAPLPGTRRWLLVNVYPAHDGLTLYFRDISAQRSAYRRLMIFEACVARLKDSIIITELDPGVSALPLVRFVNSAYEAASGRTLAELAGQPWPPLDRPQAQDAAAARCSKAPGLPEPAQAECVRHHHNGEPYWVEVDVVPVTVAGEAHGHVAIIEHDITQRRASAVALQRLNGQLEDRVRERTAELEQARHEAERANSAKSSFLATMSHELRTPLAGVIGMIDVLQETVTDAPQLEMLDLIREAAESLLCIIGDILDTAKIEAGKLVLESAPLDLGTLVERVGRTLAPTAASLGVRLDVVVDPAIDCLVLADEIRLRQVLFNLAGNAIKFSSGIGRSGQVWLRAGLVARDAGSLSVDLVVEDNGIGLDEAAAAELFAPFKQADASTTRRFGGTGLGLSICKHLLDLMGGRIEVRSTPGVGSTFTVRLTLAAGGSLGGPAGEPSLGALTCLLVGHDPALAQRLASYLVHAQARVLLLTDIEAAAALPPPDGPVVWLVLPDQCEREPGALLRQRCPPRAGLVTLRAARQQPATLDCRKAVAVDVENLSRPLLLHAVQTALEGVASGADRAGPTPAAAAARPAPRPRAECTPLSILIAEDNPLSRTVIRRQLHSLGVEAEVVEDGVQALALWRSGRFSLVLTDVHMPAMDGYALAAAIRAEEPGGAHTPIVALSANTALDEEGRCLAAGMDAFLTKPVRLPQLRAMLERHLGSLQAGSSGPAPAGEGEANSGAVDLRVLRELVGGDPDVIAELLTLFRETAQAALHTMQRAVSGQDTQALGMEAHKLTAAARSIGARGLARACELLERRAGDALEAAGVPAAWTTLRNELEAVMQQLAPTEAGNATGEPAQGVTETR